MDDFKCTECGCRCIQYGASFERLYEINNEEYAGERFCVTCLIRALKDEDVIREAE